MRFRFSAVSWSQAERNSSWVAATAAAALFAARLPSGAVETPPCFATEVAPEAEAAFFLELSFLDTRAASL